MEPYSVNKDHKSITKSGGGTTRSVPKVRPVMTHLVGVGQKLVGTEGQTRVDSFALQSQPRTGIKK